ncbi:MAG TPA: hypothetical protein DIC34_08935, partial [Treponema sp.]|nr:hypothetical protein [Treponema sp.]
MTVAQEDALYDYLDGATRPFGTAEAVAAIRRVDAEGGRRLAEEVSAFLSSRKLAFPSGAGRWTSRRTFFSGGSFAISPTRLEIRNGILIVGHRCVPFANPILLPHELSFSWKGESIERTTSEGPPEDFYPFYDLFGEEYAPQYIARDNEANEEAFNADPYEDPPDVSVSTLDMRAIYRETAFVPGDRFEARIADWKGGAFELIKTDKDAWAAGELAAWEEAAEAGFMRCFDALGPGASTEEQIAFACWYGGPRTISVPAFALEEYLYERTERIDTAQYGMETRFWRTGKEIPDSGEWSAAAGPPDKTEIESLLAGLGVPVSEYVVESYVRDALFRRETEIHSIIARLVPPPIEVGQAERLFVAQYIAETREDFGPTYNLFLDKEMGPIRQRVAELHTAVVALVARLNEHGIDHSWLPKHAFVTLSQLQAHSANLLEDLDYDDPPEERELDGMDNALDGMMDMYEEIRSAIDEALDGFRRSRLTLVKPQENAKVEDGAAWRLLQVALVGTSVWRRLLVGESMNLAQLHRCIQAALGWSGSRLHGFVLDGEVYGPDSGGGELAERNATIASALADGITEITYDYDFGAEWEAKISILSRADADPDGRPRCIAGAGAAPTENSGGPLRFRRFVSALRGEDGPEKEIAKAELGADFDPDAFDLAAADAELAGALRSAPEK